MVLAPMNFWVEFHPNEFIIIHYCFFPIMHGIFDEIPRGLYIFLKSNALAETETYFLFIPKRRHPQQFPIILV